MSHSTLIKDNDPRFTIDKHTRAITQISDNPTKVMQGDHNSEIFTFSMPRIVDGGHDMAECNSVKIHYDVTNPTTKEVITGAHEVKDMQVDPDDETKVLFTWTLSDWVTQLPGELSFLVEFKCINDNAETEYKWSTDKYERIAITPGKNHGDEISTKHADILDQWKKDLKESRPNIFDTNTPKNLLDLDSLELGKYMLKDGSVYTSASYALTDYIPVEDEQTLTLQVTDTGGTSQRRFVNFMFLTAYDADKKIITSSGISVKTNKYVVPEGIAFVRISLPNYNYYADWAVVPSEFIVPYEEYSAEKIKSKYYDTNYLKCVTSKNLALPKKIYSFVGYPSIIYFENIMPYSTNDVYVYKYGAKGKLYADRWEYTTDIAETVVGSVDIYNHDWEKMLSQKVDVVVKDTTEKQSLKVLVIGDSTVGAGKETQKMLDLATTDNYDLTLLGTQGTASNKHEGRGGWTANLYITYTQNNPFYNPTRKTFDFAYYMSQQGYDGVDCVFLQLGINDMFSPRTQATLETTLRAYLTNIETIVNSIHAYDSNIKIVLNLITPCDADQNKFGEQYDLHPRWMYNHNVYEANINLIAKYNGVTNVYINPHNAVIDTVNNINGDVHPKDEGYAQLGTQMYSFMRAIN